jgi:hypothetical protein
MDSDLFTTEFMVLIGIGLLAQIVDGTLGMAFGVISTSAILAIGLAPAQASAIVHTAEIFTTGASAASRIYHRNVDWWLVIRLGGAGVLGAVLGARISPRRQHRGATLSCCIPHRHRWLYLFQGMATASNPRYAASMGDAYRTTRRLS